MAIKNSTLIIQISLQMHIFASTLMKEKTAKHSKLQLKICIKNVFTKKMY